MFSAILKTTNSSFQKGMTFCRSIYVKKVMTLLAFIFEQPSYNSQSEAHVHLNTEQPIRNVSSHLKLTIFQYYEL